MSSKKQDFEPMGDLSLDEVDARVEQYAKEKGVGSMPTVPTAPRTAETKRVSFDVPLYVHDQIERRRYEKHGSMRYQFLKGLALDGVEIDPADLIEDRRTSKGGKK